MILYSYTCRCGKQWERFKKMKERHLEVCDHCQRVAKLEITAPRIHGFDSYHYMNRKEKETVRFRNTKERNRYLKNRSMRVMEPGEYREMRDESHEHENRTRPKYSVETTEINGIPARVANPE